MLAEALARSRGGQQLACCKSAEKAKIRAYTHFPHALAICVGYAFAANAIFESSSKCLEALSANYKSDHVWLLRIALTALPDAQGKKYEKTSVRSAATPDREASK